MDLQRLECITQEQKFLLEVVKRRGKEEEREGQGRGEEGQERKKGGEKKGRKAGGQFQCKSQVSWATSWSKKLNRIIMVFLILEFNFFQIVEALIKSKNHACAYTHTHTQSQMRNFKYSFSFYDSTSQEWWQIWHSMINKCIQESHMYQFDPTKSSVFLNPVFLSAIESVSVLSQHV